MQGARESESPRGSGGRLAGIRRPVRLHVPRVLGDLGRLLPRDRLLRVARWLGLILIAIAVVFMVRTLRSTWSGLEGWRPTPALIAVAAGGALAWAAAMYGVARAWVRLLGAFGSREAADPAVRTLYARVQIVRYAPGNAFQVGRHALGRSLGLGHVPLVAAALAEALGLVTVSAVLALLGLPLLALPDGGLGPLAIAGIAVGGLVLPLVVVVLMRRLRPLLALPRVRELALLRAWASYLLLFATGGTVLAALLAALGVPLSPARVAACGSGFALAWLAGYLAPAAPEGVGVREAVLIAVLGVAMPPPELLVAALAMRVVVVCGDGILALAAAARGEAGPRLADLVSWSRQQEAEERDHEKRGEAA